MMTLTVISRQPLRSKSLLLPEFPPEWTML